MLEICAIWVMGWVKLRTYWIKAWMSPTGDASAGTASTPPSNGHGHIAQIADKVHNRLHQAGEKLALPGRVVQSLSLVLVEFLGHRLLTG